MIGIDRTVVPCFGVMIDTDRTIVLVWTLGCDDWYRQKCSCGLCFGVMIGVDRTIVLVCTLV
jgi:hypothetical protein